MKLQGILGGGTGKLGESVFTTNAGRTIVRQYNPHVRNPRTIRQQNSRSRFSIANSVAKQFSAAIKIGLPRVGALTSRNRLTSMIIPVSAEVIKKEGNSMTVDYSKLKISKGGMPMPNVMSVLIKHGNTGFIIRLNNAYAPTTMGYIPPMPGEAGIVMVCLNVSTGQIYILQKIVGNSTSIEFDDLPTEVLASTKFYIFAKWVPETYNDVNSETLPWKFPSDQSNTYYTPLGA